ncbi:hypothetical protein HPP92_021714 [Vanilla planifolia]|uniref:Peroxidase n=1 Tax=Vanilla planifolia TaxID=51239 RepID=A0A835UJ19_VANPL|nr:hypothetical protein HPP92_021714 [Vanilla planifolia]
MWTKLAFFLLLLPTTAVSFTKDCVDPTNGSSLWFNFYETVCPAAEAIIFAGVVRAVSAEPRMAASLLRLHFHDCFVNASSKFEGCDASLLLDDTDRFVGEKTAAPNVNSVRGFDVIDGIKAELEAACPGAVSCADVLAVAARDAVLLLGGPTWQVETGRKDGLMANKSAAESNIPAPTSGLSALTQKFRNVGLTQKDMVVLSGAHTIGKARCATFSSRFGASSSGSSDRRFLDSLQQLCGSGTNDTLAALDLVTPSTFDNQYYVNLLSGDGLLPSDQALMDANAGEVEGLVAAYAADVDAFFRDFGEAMVRMGRLAAPPGRGGEVRRCCRVVNA